MQHVGICLVINEKAFDAATAVGGCGPAFVSFDIFFFFFRKKIEIYIANQNNEAT